jgi:iron(III) transport system ATP-binding protein
VSGLLIQQLKKSFKQTHVVRGLELSLDKGEIVSLLGPSGCGKTTALRMVAGLEKPDSGTISIGARPVFAEKIDLPPEKRSVGMVFQSYAVWPHRSVRENVAYPLMLRKDPRANAAADEALTLVRLSGFGDRTPDTLSGGQQQRVALARALVARPELLLFDEPLSNLDAKLREEMRHEVRELAKRLGITSLYVTHDQAEAFAVSDRVAVVLDGKIAQLAKPQEIYDEPNDLRVAGFVGRISVLEGIERCAPDRVRIGTIEARATFAPECKDALVIAVRPEHISIGDTGLPGSVLRASFLGERFELAVKTDAGELRVDSRSRYEAGETVHLSIAECRAFNREPRRS